LSSAVKFEHPTGHLSLQLDTRAGSTANDRPFACFRIGAAGDCDRGPFDFHLPLNCLGSTESETWMLDEPGDPLMAQTVRAVRNDQLLLCELSMPVNGDIYQPAFDIYEQLFHFLESENFGHVVRIWNHIPAIGAGEGDNECYKRFCLGRGEALDRYHSGRHPPAGTGVGIKPGLPLHVLVLASKRAPRLLENPRQVSAFRYPRQYGPRSPSFSRAVALRGRERDFLFVSGTAAIVGHHSQHEQDLAAQVTETLANWEQLFEVYAFGGNRLPGFHSEAVFRAYLRHPEDLEHCQTVLDSVGFPLHRTSFFQADICRSELLFELDGTLSIPLV